MSTYAGQRSLAEQKKLKKEQARLKALEAEEFKRRILPREWLNFRSDSPSKPSASEESSRIGVKVMSWNLLAQCLVRRELFPTSDCLKAPQRENMIYSEILSHNADICCLQEVDRTDKLFPVLQNAGYTPHYATGPRKRHGCLIAYRKAVFSQIGERKVLYDVEEIREEGNERARRGSSMVTRNIASMLALKRLDTDTEDEGIIVATTHLFWHPAYTYERARQAAILFREAVRFRNKIGKLHWPCIIAGDLNFTPADAVYSLLIGDPLLPTQSAKLLSSKVVHVSIDPNIPITKPNSTAEDEEGNGGGVGSSGGGGDTGNGESDPDRIITNARAAINDDGLLTDNELLSLFKQWTDDKRPISAYDQGLRQNADTNASIHPVTFASVNDVPANRLGGFEPIYTSYTHYWKNTLDYIFILDPRDRQVAIEGLAKPHPAESLEPGLPQSERCGSDHISLCASLSWPRL